MVQIIQLSFCTFHSITVHPDATSTATTTARVTTCESIRRNLTVYLNDVGDIEPDNSTSIAGLFSSSWTAESDGFVEVSVGCSNNRRVRASSSTPSKASAWGTINVRRSNTRVDNAVKCSWTLRVRSVDRNERQKIKQPRQYRTIVFTRLWSANHA